MKKEQPLDTVTIPTNELLYCLLGNEHSGSPCVPIPPLMYEILVHKLKDSLIYKVECEIYGRPYIWWYKDWYDDTDRRRRQKEYSERERVARFILAANVKIVAKAIMKKAAVSQNTAESMAYTMLKQTGGWIVINSFFGVNKLIEKEEEL